jgi:pSer/pThr/pTyr-binding forkhead associated (FHA) protein
VLHDLKSTNGTMVNDKKSFRRHVLAEGDVISTIGRGRSLPVPHAR